MALIDACVDKKMPPVPVRLSRDQLIWRIQNGAASMPPHAGVLTAQQLRDVVGFLETRK